MGRRRGGSPMRSSRSFSPARSPVRSSAITRPAPAHVAPAPQPASIAAPKQPGLFGQMAATAGGVALGSTVGHAVGHALTGGSGGISEQYVENVPQQTQPQEMQAPCSFELKQFLNCTQEQNDISLCEGFNQILKDCRMRYGANQHF